MFNTEFSNAIESFEVKFFESNEIFLTEFSNASEIFETKFLNIDSNFLTEFGSFINSGQNFPYYKGDYTVVPSRKITQLETANQILKKDVIVEAVPYSQVSNAVGGATFYIAKG